MLGICIAGNLAMVFVFWELVGICSYFLIGFYIERHSASTAANKAFIVNRVGDFGMLIGLMAIWSSAGHVLRSATRRTPTAAVAAGHLQPAARRSERLQPGAGRRHDRVRGAASKSPTPCERPANAAARSIAAEVAELARPTGEHAGHWLLFVAGVGIFCGCVGKSAQFPLHVVVARRDGRPDARLRARPLGDDGRGRRVPGRPRLSDFHARSAAGDRRASAASRCSSRRRSPSRPSTSSACWPIRRSANSAS